MDRFTRKLQKKHIWLMGTTLDILEHSLAGVSQNVAQTATDGPDGWSIVEVVCHLRDFDEFFYGRAVMMLEQDHPALPAYDQDALAIERDYAHQNLGEALAALRQSRERFIQFFRDLTDEQWERNAIHPEHGEWTMTDAVMQVGLHTVDHIEQVTRILCERETQEAG